MILRAYYAYLLVDPTVCCIDRHMRPDAIASIIAEPWSTLFALFAIFADLALGDYIIKSPPSLFGKFRRPVCFPGHVGYVPVCRAMIGPWDMALYYRATTGGPDYRTAEKAPAPLHRINVRLILYSLDSFWCSSPSNPSATISTPSTPVCSK